MQSPFYAGIGGVLSADIAVAEHERELEFYAAVLTTGNPPLWQNDLLNGRGVPIIGLGQQSPETEGLPMQWMPHFQVADVASSANTAVAEGGTQLMRDPSDQCQWAVLADPAGATFGVIPVVDSAEEPGATSGSICGLSLYSPDPTSSAAFYEQVVGWTQDPKPADPSATLSEIATRGRNDIPAAFIRPQAGANVPAVWLMHLSVGDLKESLLQVERHGGRQIHQATAGNCIVQDPLGVCFALSDRSEGN
ncbi:MAG: hypothetical protein NXI04_15100 [Planctomycetaceae bacterium]|nr:hypothetical protein [Planctomycetaceae bacterium]